MCYFSTIIWYLGNVNMMNGIMPFFTWRVVVTYVWFYIRFQGKRVCMMREKYLTKKIFWLHLLYKYLHLMLSFFSLRLCSNWCSKPKFVCANIWTTNCYCVLTCKRNSNRYHASFNISNTRLKHKTL